MEMTAFMYAMARRKRHLQEETDRLGNQVRKLKAKGVMEENSKLQEFIARHMRVSEELRIVERMESSYSPDRRECIRRQGAL